MSTENTIAHISLSEVALDVVGLSRPLVLTLRASVETDLDVTSPYAPALLCQTCLPRLPVSPVERLLLSMIVSDSLVANRIPYSYAGLGKIIGREASTLERAALTLRHMGLIRTRRMGVRGHDIAFDCQPYLEWGRRVLERAGVATARVAPIEVTSPAPTPAPTLAPAQPAAPAPVAPAPRDIHTPQEFDDVRTFVDHFAPNDHPDWPSVPGNWRAIHKIPFPWDDVSSVAVPVGKKPWLGPVPRLPNGEYDKEKLVRKPYQLMDPDGDEIGARCAIDAPVGKPQAPDPTVEDEPVDPRPEIEATLKAAGGRKPKTDDDDLDFSSGADTDESDMDPSVPINVDL